MFCLAFRSSHSYSNAHCSSFRSYTQVAAGCLIAQHLVPGVDGVMRWPATVRALVRKGKDHQFRLQISVGRADGMMTTEQSLADLVRFFR